MFHLPRFVKQYVVVASFSNGDFYLADAIRMKDMTMRTWTTIPSKAIKFNHQADAESIAAMVCNKEAYKISGISKKS